MAAKKKAATTTLKKKTPKGLPSPKEGYHYIFVPRFWHKWAKRWIYPKAATCFCFQVPDEPKKAA